MAGDRSKLEGTMVDPYFAVLLLLVGALFLALVTMIFLAFGAV